MEPNKDTPGRNDPCHCGSGRKYKQCHLAADAAAAQEARKQAAEAAARDAKEPEPEPETAAKGDAGAPGERRVTPPAHQKGENQPWKKAAGGAHPTQRKSMPRKIGSK